MRLLHQHFGADPATLGEDPFRDYILHVKTRKAWKPRIMPDGPRPQGSTPQKSRPSSARVAEPRCSCARSWGFECRPP